MPEIRDTDRYDPARNSMKQCCFCDQGAAQTTHSIEIGRCARHSAIFWEDHGGHFKQNRLKTLIDAYHANQLPRL